MTQKLKGLAESKKPLDEANAFKNAFRRIEKFASSATAQRAYAISSITAAAGFVISAVVLKEPWLAGLYGAYSTGTVYSMQTIQSFATYAKERRKPACERKNVTDGISGLSLAVDLGATLALEYYGLGIGAWPIVIAQGLCLLQLIPLSTLKATEAIKRRDELQEDPSVKASKSKNVLNKIDRFLSHPLVMSLPIGIGAGAIVASAIFKDPSIAGWLGSVWGLPFIYLPQLFTTTGQYISGKTEKIRQLSLGALAQDTAALATWAVFGAMEGYTPYLIGYSLAVLLSAPPLVMVLAEDIKAMLRDKKKQSAQT